jgi:branched-chain amino acid transport system permease protein
MRLTEITYFTLAFTLAYLSILTLYIVSKSKWSYALRAIRCDEELAEEIGINAMKYKVAALLISGLFTVFAGIVYIHYLGYAEPSVAFHISWSINPVLITILGGIQTILGPIIGAFLFVTLSHILIGFFGETSLVIWAITVILMILFASEGIYGRIKRSFHKISSLYPKSDER